MQLILHCYYYIINPSTQLSKYMLAE